MKEFANVGVTVDIYERSGSDSRTYFNSTPQILDQFADELNEEGISMRMNKVYDAAFGQMGYPFGVKSHIRCEKQGQIDGQPLIPVQRARGFNFWMSYP